MTHSGRESRGETEASDEIAYEVRDATVADAFDLALLGARAYAFRDGRPSPEMPSAGALSALASCLSRPGDWCLMHRSDAGLILAEVSGFPLDHDERPTAASARHYISSLSVLPSHWGEGHGSRMLRAAVARGHRVGVDVFEVWVATTNTRAKAVYEGAGFVASGRTKEYGPMMCEEFVTPVRESD
jgi:ribosomal protein S18 acetylase RimI-like enzyme